jgi:hypothetical protein
VEEWVEEERTDMEHYGRYGKCMGICLNGGLKTLTHQKTFVLSNVEKSGRITRETIEPQDEVNAVRIANLAQ